MQTRRKSATPMALILVIGCSCLMLLAEGLPLSSQGKCLSNQADKEPLAVGQSVHHLTDNPKVSSINSVDICFAISGITSMPLSERWIPQLSIMLDNRFKAAGIGSETGYENRFCVIQFGARNTRAKIVKVNDSVFFDSTNTGGARSELRQNGNVADGYEALEFAINSVPFRSSRTVARGIILVSDTGRATLADRVNLTTPLMSRLLKEYNVTLDVISNMKVQSNDRVLGLLDYYTKVVYENDSVIVQTDDVTVDIVGSHGNTLTNYAELAFHSGGGAWLIDTLYLESSSDEYKDRVAGVAMGYVNSRNYLQTESCQVCMCHEDTSLTCYKPVNQRLCQNCIGNSNSPKCLATSATEGYPLQIFHQVSQQPGNYVNISFQGNREDVLFECLLLDSVDTNINPCSSPLQLSGLAAGLHQVAIIGRTVDGLLMDSKIASFIVPPKSNYPLMIEVIGRIFSDDGQEVTVDFRATSPYSTSHVTVTCSIDGGQYQLCSSPIRVPRINKWQRSLTIMATDEFGGLSVSQETLHYRGEDRYSLETGNIVNSKGAMEILLYSSNDPKICYCSYEKTFKNWFTCTPDSTGSPFKIIADPIIIGEGHHELFGGCSYKSGVLNYKMIGFELRSKPVKSIDCSLNVLGPFHNQSIVADFNCHDNTLVTSCTLDSLPTENCTTWQSFGTGYLVPGFHTFTFVATDTVSGAEHINVQPFFVNTNTEQQCCPMMIDTDTRVSVDKGTRKATLNMATTRGSCSPVDKFRYEINWGDGAISSGLTAGHVSPLQFTRTYSSDGQFSITLNYCSNSVDNDSNCCSEKSFQLDVTT